MKSTKPIVRALTVRALRGPAAVLLAISTAVLAASALPVDTKQSKLTATFTQMNVPVEAPFTRFTGSVAFDTANPAASEASLEVDTASFDIGDEDYNAEVRKKEWFDSSAYPKASFVSTQVKPLSPGRFQAVGSLSLKGKSQPVTATFEAKTQGGRQVYEGSLPLSRKAFGIGDPEWEGVLEDTVTVKFSIVAGG